MKKALLLTVSILSLNATSSVTAEVVQQRPPFMTRMWNALTSCFTPQNIDRTLEYLDTAAQAATAVTKIVAPSAVDEVQYVATIIHAASVAYDPPRDLDATAPTPALPAMAVSDVKLEQKMPQGIRFSN